MHFTRRLRFSPLTRRIASRLFHSRYRGIILLVLLVIIYRLHFHKTRNDKQTLVLESGRRLFIRLYKDNDQRRHTTRAFRILSGSLHYFRVLSQSWSERIEQMKAAGLNTVETFVPWNVHEREKGNYQFDDLIKFIELIKKHEMFAIIRPTAYIGAEWDLGGLPSWLLYDDEMAVRSTYAGFMEPLEKYYSILLPILAKYQYNRRSGGSIIAFQIEHEYGSYGQDKDYLERLRAMYVKHGLDEILFTADAPQVLSRGTLPNVWATINIQRDVTTRTEKLVAFREEDHVFIADYWTGWYDQWGRTHKTGNKQQYDADELESDLEELLLTSQYEVSVNFYMFAGGTNFGFTAGANHFHFNHFSPVTTSYDCDAPISESGDVTKKYTAIRNVLRKFYEQNPTLVVYNHERVAADTFDVKDGTEPKKVSYGKIKVIDYKTFEQILADKKLTTTYQSDDGPLCMEDLKKNTQTQGFIVYVNNDVQELIQAAEKHTLSIPEIADSAVILSNGEQVVQTNHTEYTVQLDIPADTKTITILVENMGRIYYGPGLDYARKGILNNVILDNTIEVKKWNMILLEFRKPMSDLTDWKKFIRNEDSTVSELNNGPKLFRATFTIEEGQPIEDTFLYPGSAWTKGVAFINNFNLGRYWKVGPQKTLYIPKHLLVKGVNYIYMFELITYGQEVQLIDKPIIIT